MNLSKNGQYSAACNKYYEIKHNCFNDTSFKHPNTYFNESVKHHTSHCYHGEISLSFKYQTIYYSIKFNVVLKLKVWIWKQKMHINYHTKQEYLKKLKLLNYISYQQRKSRAQFLYKYLIINIHYTHADFFKIKTLQIMFLKTDKCFGEFLAI